MIARRETRLFVTGMTCTSCARHVERAAREVEGVSTVEVRLGSGAVVVEHDSDTAPLERLVRAAREAGYEVTSSS